MTDQNDTAQWKRMRFKRNKVWMAVDGNRQPLVENGKVLIKYQLDQPHEYRVHLSSVRTLEESPPDQPAVDSQKPVRNSRSVPPQKVSAQETESAIRIYTDGACSGNPGPAGIGVVMKYQDMRKEISHHIGMATNNVAELEAIHQGLVTVKNRQLPVIIFTDSSYAMGVLTQGWKATRNQELVARIIDLLREFRQVKFVKVKGHAGHPENERADHLAVRAIQKNKTPLPPD